MPATRILMVCMGNICRSPTAEGVMRAQLRAAGLDKEFTVASAGTTGYHGGEAPDPRAVRHAAARGYDLSAIRARRVSRDDFQRFDWLLAMDQDNLDGLLEVAPDGHGAQLGLLMAHARSFPGIHEVPDPYYGAPAGFERVLDLVEDACQGFVEMLQRRKIDGTS